MNKLTIPLSKNEIKTKTNGILSKYGVDPSKCCLKIINI